MDKDCIHVAQVKCGQDVFDVVVTPKQARCLLNGIDIMGNKDLDSFAPIVAQLVVSSTTVPGTVISIKKNPSFGDFLKGLVDTVSKSDQAKIKVLESVPDEIADQKPKQASRSFTPYTLDGYRCGVRALCDCFNDVLSLSEILLKTKLPKNVMAFKDLTNTLAKVRTATTELSKNRDHCEIVIEHTGSNIGRVMVAMGSNLNDPNIKRIVQESVDHVVADFMGTKKLLASLINSHYPLYDINPLFKKHTDYPATWFFDPSVFYNFTERYKDASDSLIEAVRTEASVIRPLYNWKTKVTGE